MSRKTDVAPVDAAQTVVILATAGACLMLFGVMGILNERWQPGFWLNAWSTPMIVVGAVSLIVALAVKGLGSRR